MDKFLSDPELARLSAFDQRLAARACSILYFLSAPYSDLASIEARELAVKWGLLTDPFVSSEIDSAEALRDGAFPFAPAGTLSPSFFNGNSVSASLAQLILYRGDRAAIDALCSSEAVRVELFSDRAGSVALVASQAIQSNDLSYAKFLMDRLRPEVRSVSNHSDPWKTLVQACSLTNDLSLLGLAGSLYKQATGESFSAGALFSQSRSGSPLISFARDLERFGFPWHAPDLLTFAKDAALRDPPDWALAEWGLSQWRDRAFSEIPQGASLSAQSEKLLKALWIGSSASARTTPLPWIDMVLSMGLKPFAPLGSSASPAYSLVFGLSSLRGDEELRKADHLVSDILFRMAKASTDGISERYDGKAPFLSGARRTDILTQCLCRGLWECARVLAEAGADWKPAKKQIEEIMLSGNRKTTSLAFLEGLSLRDSSAKATARRDKAFAKKGIQPAAPKSPKFL